MENIGKKNLYLAGEEGFNALVARYMSIIGCGTDDEDDDELSELENAVDELTEEKEQLEDLLEEFPEMKQNCDDMLARLQKKKGELAELESERAALGFFAFGKKKELDDKISSLSREIGYIKSAYDREKAKTLHYSSVEDIEAEIERLNDEIEEAEENLRQFKADNRVRYTGTEEEVISDLLSPEFLKMTLQSSEVMEVLLENRKTFKIIESNHEIMSSLYGKSLPKELLDVLEGTDDELYFVNREDGRTAEELHEDFRAFYRQDLFRGYEIQKNVSPEYFGEHPKCKPVNFLFRKNGKDLLAVSIVKYSSIKHPAVNNVKLACIRNGIKYIHFIIGYPNKEHYVVRRTLEMLGEIRALEK